MWDFKLMLCQISTTLQYYQIVCNPHQTSNDASSPYTFHPPRARQRPYQHLNALDAWAWGPEGGRIAGGLREGRFVQRMQAVATLNVPIFLVKAKPDIVTVTTVKARFM